MSSCSKNWCCMSFGRKCDIQTFKKRRKIRIFTCLLFISLVEFGQLFDVRIFEGKKPLNILLGLLTGCSSDARVVMAKSSIGGHTNSRLFLAYRRFSDSSCLLASCSIVYSCSWVTEEPSDKNSRTGLPSVAFFSVV